MVLVSAAYELGVNADVLRHENACIAYYDYID